MLSRLIRSHYGLTLPVMPAVGIAATLARRLSHGIIYTQKLRGGKSIRPLVEVSAAERGDRGHHGA